MAIPPFRLLSAKSFYRRRKASRFLVNSPSKASSIFLTEFFGPPLVVSGGFIKFWTGSIFSEKPVKYWNGSAWVQKPVKFWNGTAWTLS